MSPITTHVLDLMRGRPAPRLFVRLERCGDGDRYEVLGEGHTDAQGRLSNLLPDGAKIVPGSYRLSFDVVPYFEAQGVESFYPAVHIIFVVSDPAQHYHVPLLLSPFGYSTYRGS
jgi:5-hydroxyisourate hydrolase